MHKFKFRILLAIIAIFTFTGCAKKYIEMVEKDATYKYSSAKAVCGETELDKKLEGYINTFLKKKDQYGDGLIIKCNTQRTKNGVSILRHLTLGIGGAGKSETLAVVNLVDQSGKEVAKFNVTVEIRYGFLGGSADRALPITAKNIYKIVTKDSM
jgi:lipoprotein